MKKAYLAVVAISCIALHAAGRKNTDLQEADLKGRVAQVTEVKYTCPKHVSYGCIMRVPPNPKYATARTAHTIDEYGNQVLVVSYNKDDQLVTKEYCTYDANKNKTESVIRGSDESMLSRTVYKYDEKGYPAETDYYNKKDSLYNIKKWEEHFFYSKDEYRYDTKGRLTGHNIYAEDGTVNKPYAATVKPDTLYDKDGRIAMTSFVYEYKKPGHKKYVYDEKGNLTEVDYSRDGDPQSIPVNKYIYSLQGNLLTAIEDNLNGTHFIKDELFYNEQGNKTEEKYYVWRDGSYFLSWYKLYNDAGNETEECGFLKDGSFQNRSTKEYDAKGNLLRYQTYDKDSTIKDVTNYRYEAFDKNGNWHKMINWSEQEDFSYPKVYITNREIKYYQ